MSNRIDGKPLWRVRPIVDGHADESAGRAFVGTEVEMVAHINALHRETGIQHAATSVE